MKISFHQYSGKTEQLLCCTFQFSNRMHYKTKMISVPISIHGLLLSILLHFCNPLRWKAYNYSLSSISVCFQFRFRVNISSIIYDWTVTFDIDLPLLFSCLKFKCKYFNTKYKVSVMSNTIRFDITRIFNFGKKQC